MKLNEKLMTLFMEKMIYIQFNPDDKHLRTAFFDYVIEHGMSFRQETIRKHVSELESFALRVNIGTLCYVHDKIKPIYNLAEMFENNALRIPLVISG